MTDKVIMKAGKYYLGDPCYVIKNEEWQNILDSYFAKNMEIANTPFEHDGFRYVWLDTKYGDGTYPSKNAAQCMEFPVDSGMIGLVPIDSPIAIDEESVSPSTFSASFRIVTFHYDIECYVESNGTMHFGSIEIYTGDQDEEEENDYEEKEDDDSEE